MFDLITQNQELLIKLFKIVVYTSCLFFMLVLAGYNSLYLIRILKANERIGLHPPENLHYLVRISIFLALFTSLTLVIFLVKVFLFG